MDAESTDAPNAPSESDFFQPWSENVTFRPEWEVSPRVLEAPRWLPRRGGPMGSVFLRSLARRVNRSGVPESPSGPEATVTLETTIALADALVGMLEYQHPFFRGGSSLVRLVAGALAHELGVGEEDQQALALAALLRDLGRIRLGGENMERPRAELDAVDLRRIEAHVEVGLDLLEGIGLPGAIRDAIRHHHERWDGQGYPDGLSGEEIPLLARILGVADAFVAMIQPRVYRPSRRVPAVLEELRQEAGRRYDPVIVDAAERVLAGPPSRRLGFGLRQHVLVIHPDEDRGTVLSTRLCSKGYLAEVALSAEAAWHRMERARIGVVLLASEPGDMSAATFVSDLRADPRFEAIRILVVGADSPGRRVALLEAGSDVCFPSDVDFDELLGTLGALLSRSLPNGSDAKPWHVLEGGLADFPLPWLLQVLQYDSHSGSVVIAGPDEQEGLIVLSEGTPRHARLGDCSGEDALRAMLRWSTGRFSVRSDVQTSESTIEAPLMLILLDEAATQDRANVFGAALEPA